MIRKLLIPGIISGIIAGALLTLVQQFQVIPLILEAETYEVQSESHSHSDQSQNIATALNHSEQQEWNPEDGTERTLYTLMTNILLGLGFSLLLISLMTVTNHSGWQSGLLWGLAGFCVFYLAPSLGIPPELPGTVQAKFEHRQLWWAVTVISTAIGLSFILLTPAMSYRVFGILFLIAPHFFTTSVSVESTGPIPTELTNSFIIATSVANMIFWSVLGTLNGLLKSQYFETNSIQKTAT